MNSIAAVFILYCPSDALLENLLSVYNYVEQIYIYDNTEGSCSTNLFQDMPKVRFFHDGSNRGISERLNAACKLAIDDNFQWLLTIDQDTNFPNESLEIYLRCAAQYIKQHNKMALFGPVYSLEKVTSTMLCQPVHTHFIITSGMLLNLSLFQKIGNFDEKLFIDMVDHEYCLRARSKGFDTIQFKNIFLTHQVGKPVYKASIKTLYLKKKFKHIHSPLRCYYMLRNFLYVSDKYKKLFPDLIEKNRKAVKMNLDWSLYYGGKATQTLWYILKARGDFKKGKMGKLTIT